MWTESGGGGGGARRRCGSVGACGCGWAAGACTLRVGVLSALTELRARAATRHPRPPTGPSRVSRLGVRRPRDASTDFQSRGRARLCGCWADGPGVSARRASAVRVRVCMCVCACVRVSVWPRRASAVRVRLAACAGGRARSLWWLARRRDAGAGAPCHMIIHGRGLRAVGERGVPCTRGWECTPRTSV
jgi:hypothetical protein